jgi:hypothetical protein
MAKRLRCYRRSVLPFLIAIPPLVALGVGATWAFRPDLRRDATLRGALIVSVSVAAIEAMLAALGFGFLWLMSTSTFDF